MTEIVCYTPFLPVGEETYITFLDLLLNDNLANGQFDCPEEVYAVAGNINSRLSAKQNYEFLLRAALDFPIKLVGTNAEDADFSSEDSSFDVNWDAFRTDCYVAGKYSQILRENDLFNPVVQTLIASAAVLPDSSKAQTWLEKMISHSPEFYEIDDDTRPILIYRGDDTCYNQLNIFADELAKALMAQHQRIEIFDVGKEDLASITKCCGQRFKAIIGIQTYLFSIKLQDKVTNLHDKIIGPKFNMILDHPVLLKEHLTKGPSDYYLLLHDRNYMEFAKKHYKNIKDCFFFTPAGIRENCCNCGTKKIYDVSFIGTYYDYRSIISSIRKFDKRKRYIANRFLIELRGDLNKPSEKALENVLKHYEMDLSDTEFLELLFELRYVFFGVMYYYREKVIRTLLDGGIEINVYGSSWNTSPFKNHPFLKIHPGVVGEEVLNTMAKSNISLNIMAWHKDGFTERIANSMLNDSVVVSDTSTQLEELFENGKDLVLFDLNALETLPSTIQNLLSSKEDLSNISMKGYETALKNHLWDNRAKQFLEILNQLSN